MDDTFGDFAEASKPQSAEGGAAHGFDDEVDPEAAFLAREQAAFAAAALDGAVPTDDVPSAGINVPAAALDTTDHFFGRRLSSRNG